MINRTQKGFTLIELLVVIAIIGLLASVVLAAVGTARKKGQDAAIKSQMESARSQMELYASNNTGAPGGYSGGCAAASSATPAGLAAILLSASSEAGGGTTAVTAAATAGAFNTVTCHDSQAAWAAEGPLSASVSGTPSMFCVDSAGAAKVEAAVLAASTYVCS